MSEKKLEKHGPVGLSRQTKAREILEKRQQNQPSEHSSSKKFPNKGPKKKRG